jgi:4-amino-4-deoxy-L-arabinose transferase-like glycosyltransferase
VAQVGVAVVVLAGLVLRFWTRSALWLDEALTVDIARLPVREIPSYLKRDGAPPLYYVMLHFWMKVFGSSDLGTRSMSAVFSVATLPVAWVAGRRFGGRSVGWMLVVMLATAPFAVYYGTEARMYSLVMFLTACGFVAISRALERPRPGNLVALAVVVAALLYTQYWAVYLTGSLALWLLWQAWRGKPEWRSSARWMIGAVVVGVLSFVPWLPTFIFQARHTGTPWAAPANFAAIINAVTGFTDNQATLSTAGSNQGRLLALCYFALAGLAVFGLARDRWHIDLDIRTRPPARIVAFVVVLTLLAAITGGIVSGSAFSPRYAAVVFVPLLLLVAFGAFTLADARLRLAVAAVVVVAGLAASVENVWTQRTQAPQVVSALDAHARPGDVVAFCPDQLGPAVYRLTASGQTDRSGSSGRYRMITFPRGIGPAFVDWVNYDKVAEAASPAAFARKLERMAGSDHDIWLVSAPGYIGFGAKCGTLATDLQRAPGYGSHQWVTTDPAKYYEPMGLTQFAPPTGVTATSGT